MTAEAFAPAKVNLCLHVTGLRGDGYHLLDSLVAFADVGDTVRAGHAPTLSLRVTGPRAAGVPSDGRNLCWRAAEAFGAPAALTLDKHLPASAGIGGGSSDAAATLRALEALTGRSADLDAATLGADVPVCLLGRAARMRGVGEDVAPVALPPLPAVLVNPGVAVATPAVFAALPVKTNPPLPDLPQSPIAADWIAWLAGQRNDLQDPALSLVPQIAHALAALDDAALARMSGSGATCFGIYPSDDAAAQAARRIAAAQPDWWVTATTLA